MLYWLFQDWAPFDYQILSVLDSRRADNIARRNLVGQSERFKQSVAPGDPNGSGQEIACDSAEQESFTVQPHRSSRGNDVCIAYNNNDAEYHKALHHNRILRALYGAAQPLG